MARAGREMAENEWDYPDVEAAQETKAGVSLAAW